MRDLARLRDNVAQDMLEIVKMFGPDAKITVIVREPGRPDHDFLSTDDSLDEIIGVVGRRKAELATQAPDAPADE